MVSAFTLDGLANSHPIKVPVFHPDEINEIFDSISYNKVLHQIVIVCTQFLSCCFAVYLMEGYLYQGS